ncbi:acyl-CoA desaturase [Thiotrichales bacterium 19S3-7]|nr:acyl-CoA desaturase [Thiotrichales bacterium 19S3-7]MCF6800635.1 acyl-CoA desaturase [Thiotrichales bacterium 19S3-11]
MFVKHTKLVEHSFNREFSWLVFSLVLIIHLLPLSAFFTPFYVADIWLFLISYSLRVFALTAGYHRYFSHKSFETSRVFQFILAYIGATALQGGVLWWASHHRLHHKLSDTKEDAHSPKYLGFLHSHFGWFMQKKNLKAHYHLIRDFSRYPELRFLERYWYITPLPILILLYYIGGLNYVIWGYFVPTVFVNNVTYMVNSVAHLFGSRRYQTKDDSRNNLIVALLTFGEGWHNNHHRFAASVRQGFRWYQIDISYILLKILFYLGIVKNLKPVPKRVLMEGKYELT